MDLSRRHHRSLFSPLVGKSLNTWGNIGFGVFLAISAYFIYNNFITNPEFYKSLKLSREASQRDAHEKAAQYVLLRPSRTESNRIDRLF